jgi:hypothetical protein
LKNECQDIVEELVLPRRKKRLHTDYEPKM